MSSIPDGRPNRDAAMRAWTATVRVSHRHLRAIEAAFARADSLSVRYAPDGSCHIQATFGPDLTRAGIESAVALAAAASGIAAPVVEYAALPERDWVADGLAALVPVRAGRFRLRGAHHAPGPSIHELLIDAGPAFGTGHHETTRGCLLALDALARRRSFVRPLDMGCGSGVLAMAMARLWRRRVLAVDNDPTAVAVARENARRNRLAPLVECRVGAGFAGFGGGARYDLVAANILAGPLVVMAPALAARLVPGGVAILSGILRGQAEFVLAACRRNGLILRRRRDSSEWSTLCLFKPRWLGDLDSNQDCSGQSRKFYR